jgi:hypothetical protein
MIRLMFAARAALALAGLCGALLAIDARAAVTPNSVVTPQAPDRGVCQFLQGTDAAGTYKTCFTPQANGAKCFGGWETNNDASATHLITIEVVNGGVKFGGTSFTTASNDGYANATPSKSWTSSTTWTGLPVDSDGNPYFFLAPGDTLQATFATALTASDKINLEVTCVDF